MNNKASAQIWTNKNPATMQLRHPEGGIEDMDKCGFSDYCLHIYEKGSLDQNEHKVRAGLPVVPVEY